MNALLTLALVSRVLPAEVLNDSLFIVRVNRDESTLLSGWSHNHVIHASVFIAKATLDPENQRCTLELSVPVRRLVVDDPQMRKRYRLESKLSTKDRDTIRHAMLAEDQLYADRYPTIELKSYECRLTPKGMNLAAELKIRGVQRRTEIRLHRSDDGQGDTRLRGSFAIHGSDFGVEPYSAAWGSLKNQDRLTFYVDVRFRLQGGRHGL